MVHSTYQPGNPALSSGYGNINFLTLCDRRWGEASALAGSKTLTTMNGRIQEMKYDDPHMVATWRLHLFHLTI